MMNLRCLLQTTLWSKRSLDRGPAWAAVDVQALLPSSDWIAKDLPVGLANLFVPVNL